MRKRPVALALAVLHLFTACYTYSPLRTDPAAGTRVALEFNDEGRVALTRALGPGVVRIEGRLVGLEGDELVLDASSVTQIGSRPMTLDAVRVRVRKDHVVLTEQKQLSRKRTAMLIGGAVVLVATFFASKGWFGRSTPPEEPGGPPGPNQSKGWFGRSAPP